MGNNKIHEKIIIGLILITLFSLLTTNVFATESLFFSHGTGDKDYDFGFGAGYGRTSKSSGGGLEGNDEYLTKVAYYIDRNGQESGYLYVALFNGTPTGGEEPLEISSPIYTTDLSDTYTVMNFSFTGTTKLETGQLYTTAIMGSGGLGSYIYVGGDSEGLGSLFSTDAGVSWQSGGSYEAICYIYTDTEESEGGEGSYVYPPSGDYGDLIDAFAAFIVPVAIMLLPAILFIVFFKKTDKWLILIGLAIGTGLGYYFGLVPVWLVFLVAIGLIGLAYSEVRRNG